jgi:hypothetical protein
MYVTAHLVLSKSGEEGINAFLHLHGAEFPWPEDAAPLADEAPGKIMRRRVDLPPGSNRVKAYLDVLAPDKTTREQLEAAIAALARDLGERVNPTVFVHGDVTIRFGVQVGLVPLRNEQLHTLSSIALTLLSEWQRVGPRR